MNTIFNYFFSSGYASNNIKPTYSQICEAIQKRNLSDLKSMLSTLQTEEKQSFLNEIHSNQSLLDLACRNPEHLEIAEELAAQGASFSSLFVPTLQTSRDLFKSTNHLEIKFLEHLSALSFAQFCEIMKEKDEQHNTFIHLLINAGDISRVQSIFNALSPEKKEYLFLQNGIMDSLYVNAIHSKKIEILQFLLEQCPEAKLKHALSGICLYASEKNNEDLLLTIFKYTFSKGVLFSLMLESKNEKDKTSVLHSICLKGHLDSFQWLVRHLNRNDMMTLLSNKGNDVPPLFLAVKQKHNNLALCILKQYPQTLHTVSEKGNNILHMICSVGNYEILNALDGLYYNKSHSSISDWKELIVKQNSDGYFPVSHLSQDKSYSNESDRIRCLLTLEKYFPPTDFYSYLKSCVIHGQNLLHLSLIPENFKLAETLLSKYPELARQMDNKGSNMYHILATVKSNLNFHPNETERVNFFKKYYAQFPLDLDKPSNTENTALNLTKICNLRALGIEYLKKLNGKAPNTDKRFFTKWLAHAWAIENTPEFELNEKYSYLNKLTSWNASLALNALSETLGQFINENSSKKEYAYLIPIREAINACLNIHQKKIHEVVQRFLDNKLWVFPVHQELNHAVTLVGYQNPLIICDRSPLTVSFLNSNEKIYVEPGYKIFRLSEPISKEQLQTLLTMNVDSTWDLIKALTDLKAVKVEDMGQKKQPVNNCSWTNAKGIVFAGLFLLLMKSQNSTISKEDAYKKARELYRVLGNYMRYYVLKKYKQEINASDPLVETVELKACINHILKFLQKLKDRPDHLIQAMDSIQPLKNKLTHTDQKLQWIKTMMSYNIPRLNESIRIFIHDHNFRSIKLD